MDSSQEGTQNDWQQLHRTKRKTIFSSQPTLQTPQTFTQNRYEMLTEEIPSTDQATNTQPTKKHKPPPQFFYTE